MKIECQWQWTVCAVNSFLWLLPYNLTSHKVIYCIVCRVAMKYVTYLSQH